MEVSKVLLYCTKKKPYLFENYTDKVTWDKVFARKFGEWNRFMLIGAKPDYIGSGNYYLNGFVCFECDCKEAFNIYVRYSKEDICKSGFVTVCHDKKQFYEHSKVSFEESHKYFQRFPIDEKENVGFAYHFENVKPIDPMPITQLFKDEACTIPLTRAPESYCFAYRKIRLTPCGKKEEEILYRTESTPFEENGISWIIEKVLVFSIHSTYLALEANINPETGKPYKDLEVRKTRIQNAGIEYK